MVLNNHGNGLSTAVLSAASASKFADGTGIKEDTFKLLLKELDYDQKCFKVWLGKMQSHAACVQHQLQEWLETCNRHSKGAAEAFLSQACNFGTYQAVSPGIDVTNQYQTFKKSIEQRLQLPKNTIVPCQVVQEHV